MELIDCFAWAVPSAFRDALSQCLFSEGDILYDRKEGYNKWSDALQHVNYVIQVRYASLKTKEIDIDKVDAAFKRNWHLHIELDLWQPKEGNLGNPERIVCTQGKLYCLLWHGDLSVLKIKKEPHAPLLWKQSRQWLHRTKSLELRFAEGRAAIKRPVGNMYKEWLLKEDVINEYVKVVNSFLLESDKMFDSSKIESIEEKDKLISVICDLFDVQPGTGYVFIMTFDSTVDIYVEKFKKLVNNSKGYRDLTLRDAGIKSSDLFLPTIIYRAFIFEEQQENKIIDILEKSLKGKKTEQFRHNSHGILMSL